MLLVTSNPLVTSSHGLQPNSDGLQPSSFLLPVVMSVGARLRRRERPLWRSAPEERESGRKATVVTGVTQTREFGAGGEDRHVWAAWANLLSQ